VCRNTLSKARTAPLTHIRYLLFTLSRFTLQITVVSRYLLPQIQDKYFPFITKYTQTQKAAQYESTSSILSIFYMEQNIPFSLIICETSFRIFRNFVEEKKII